MKKGYFKVFLFVTLAVAVFPMQFAFAYIDPSTTSYIIQIVAGVFIALGAAIGIFWKKIRLAFRNMKMKSLEKKLQKQAARNAK